MSKSSSAAPTVATEMSHQGSDQLTNDAHVTKLLPFRWLPGNRETSLLLAPAVALLGIFFFIPLAGLLVLSFISPEPTFEHYREFLFDKTSWVILGRTFTLATSVTFICLLLGYPLAYWIVTGRKGVARILLLAVVLPFFTSYLVRTYAWMVLLGRYGIINQALMALGVNERPIELIYNQISVMTAMVYILMPFTVLVLISVMKGIPGNLTRAAASLGASAAQNFWRIYFPLSAPGVTAAGLLVFVFALGFYITPALLGGTASVTLPMLIETQVSGTLNWPLAAAVATVLLVITLALYLVSNRFVGIERLLGSQTATIPATHARRREATTTYGRMVDLATSTARLLPAPVRNLPVPASLVPRALSILIALFLVSPMLIIVPISFSSSRFLEFPPTGFSTQWYQDYLGNQTWISATWQSLGVGIATAFVSLLVGGSAALAIVRGSPRLRRVGYQLLLAPLIVPVIISAVALYFLFAKLKLNNSSVGIVIAHSIGAVPLVVLIVAASLQGLNIRLEHAAASLGASRVQTILRIVVPLIAPSLVVAGFFAFLHSFDEVVLSLFVTGPGTMTLPVKMWSGIREEISPTIAAVSTLMIAFTLIIHAVVERIRRTGNRNKG